MEQLNQNFFNESANDSNELSSCGVPSCDGSGSMNKRNKTHRMYNVFPKTEIPKSDLWLSPPPSYSGYP